MGHRTWKKKLAHSRLGFLIAENSRQSTNKYIYPSKNKPPKITTIINKANQTN
jgi:hypothetical protein